ncbi:MAG: ribose-5-phosphate isomerase [Proteobacteria bacterium SG_bin5]|nr:ribose 5-phosphate isomerase B [Sphingomonas sp.]OQW43509.1 MAG: ribose-5-phosphate isomerase [Proteobacteria bacterium SG_bin5]
MQLAIASDHAGYPLKAALVPWLEAEGHEVLDLGTDGTASVDYPDFGRALAEAVADGRAQRGIAICGTGIGISIAVNRHPALRCARVDEPVSAALARQHNDANAIALGARLIGEEMARACLTAFLSADFEGGRHQPRVDKLGARQEMPA